MLFPCPYIYVQFSLIVTSTSSWYLTGMRQVATILRHIFARLRPLLHSGHTEWVIKTYLRQSHECRTIIAWIIGELELEFTTSSHTCCTTFARQPRDIRETLARCSHNELANIYHQGPSHDVFANVVRLSLEGRTIVARRFSEKMINQEKINILAII